MKNLTTAIFLFLLGITLGQDQVTVHLNRLARTSDPWQRIQLIKFDLWKNDDPRIGAAFRQLLTTNVTEEAYFVAQYLAKKGDTNALLILNSHNFEYPIPSVQWSCTLRAFGENRFTPAISNLIEDIDAASFNVVDEALTALRVFYPDAPANFTSLETMKAYFAERYSEEANPRPSVRPRQLNKHLPTQQ